MKFSDQAVEMLAALGSGDPERIERAKEGSRAAFWAALGTDPVEVCPECQEERCPIWLPLREAIAGVDDDESLRAALENTRLHSVAEIPCVTCGGATCNIFFCYAENGGEKRG